MESKIQKLKNQIKDYPIQSGAPTPPVLGMGIIPTSLVEMILELDSRVMELENAGSSLDTE